MAIDLGMPQPAREPLAPRRKSRQITVGTGKHAVPVGGGAPRARWTSGYSPNTGGPAMPSQLACGS